MPDDLILTPGGYRPKSKVDVVEHGNVIDESGGRLRKLSPDGKVLTDYGPFLRRSVVKPRPSSTAMATVPAAPGTNHSWVMAAWWFNDTGSPIRSFKTTWKVPTAPKTSSGQTLYLFNGIENVPAILQPVLQWGTAADGGGSDWTIACWYVTGTGDDGAALFTPPYNVNPGQTVTGTMTYMDMAVLDRWSIGYPMESGTTIQSSQRGLAMAAAALDAFNDRDMLFCAFVADDGSNNLYVSSSTDGVYWSAGQKVGQQSQTAPAMVFFDRKLYLAFVATDGTNNLYVSSSTDGTRWTGGVKVNQQSRDAPALAALNGQLRLAFVADDGSNNLYVSTLTESGTWSGGAKVDQQCQTAPAMATLGSKLYLAFVATDGTDNLYVTSSTDAKTWLPGPPVSSTAGLDSTRDAPALAVFNGQLLLGFVATDGTNNLYVTTLTAAGTWSGGVKVDQQGQIGPAMAPFGSKVYLGFVATDGTSDLYVCAYPTTVFNYTCEIQVGGTMISSLSIQNVQELKSCSITFEEWNITKCSDYPDAVMTAMTGIEILTLDGKAPSLAWESYNYITNCGQHATVVSDANNASPGGEVDLYYS
jgi:hypothetical protein